MIQLTHFFSYSTCVADR